MKAAVKTSEARKIGKPPKEPGPELPKGKLRKILRKREVMALLGLGHTALQEAVARGDLPKPITITEHGRTIAWFEDELIEHLETRAAARNAK